MMLKRSTTESKPSAKARLLRAGVASLAAAGAIAALATGCLDRPIAQPEPKTSNVFVDQIIQTSVDKIDLLFMIDNSVSMADKQEILKAAVPVLVNRLVSPICVDPTTGKPTTGSANAQGTCPNQNDSPEFSPIGDIHIGIVSSSLGAHGGSVCSMATSDQDHLDDKAHLIPSVRTGVASYNNSGFLAWDASLKYMPPGENSAGNLTTAFSNMIEAVGEHGCGYEASLESWYRFLVDPEPPDSVTLVGQATVRSSVSTIDAATGKPVCTGCDTTLLAQRAAFLRPDSLVAIVMLSDENDCSIRDDGVGWFVGSSARMPLSTKACETNPNDPCCRSCAQNETKPPGSCASLADDETCKTKAAGASYATWDALHDSLNLRCFNQHQRFGFDLLYETSRYVNALTQQTIPLQSSQGAISVTNPLYDTGGTGKAPRNASLVFLAGIVGVPWQDIADADSLTGAGLTYLTAQELRDQGRWDVLLGTPGGNPAGSAPVPPSDPFMQETFNERTGTNAIANVAIAPANSTNPKANVINGHEQHIPDFADLQYACTFPLAMPKTCAAGDAACDCSPDKTGDTSAVVAANSPLCQPPGGGAAATTQYSAKAYPGARELQVLKDFGDNGIVASICPKVTTSNNPSTDPNYGYNPAVGAIIERLKEALKGKCLPRKLATDDVVGSATQGQVLCKVIEAQKSGCNCAAAGGRGVPDPSIIGPVQAQLKASGNCDGAGQTPCAQWCECEILQYTNTGPTADLTSCQGGGHPGTPGYCYVDSNQALLAKCPANEQQLLAFSSTPDYPTPAQGAVAFIACLGAPIGVAN